MDQDQINNLAERIARLIATTSKPTDLKMLRESIDKLSARLDKLESQSTIPQSAIRAPQTAHPGYERFNIAEAIADQVFAKLGKEKACTLEPNDKPCDHCSMCSSRGF